MKKKGRYIRQSTSQQSNLRQLAKSHPDEKLFIDIISGSIPFGDRPAGKKLIGKEEHIKNMFTNYVDKYIKAVQKEDKNILNSMEYRFTTLVNYHAELELP